MYRYVPPVQLALTYHALKISAQQLHHSVFRPRFPVLVRYFSTWLNTTKSDGYQTTSGRSSSASPGREGALLHLRCLLLTSHLLQPGAALGSQLWGGRQSFPATAPLPRLHLASGGANLGLEADALELRGLPLSLPLGCLGTVSLVRGWPPAHNADRWCHYWDGGVVRYTITQTC